jgi:hypothetical protein
VCTAVSRDTCSTTVSLPESLNASLINRSVETVPTVEPVETETVETVETETHSVAKDLFSDGGRGGGGEAVGGQSSEGGGAVSSTKNTLRSRKVSRNTAATISETMLQQPQSCNNQALGRVSPQCSEGAGSGGKLKDRGVRGRKGGGRDRVEGGGEGGVTDSEREHSFQSGGDVTLTKEFSQNLVSQAAGALGSALSYTVFKQHMSYCI